MYVFVGGSVSGRNQEDARAASGRFQRICQVLNRLGYSHHGDILVDKEVHKDSDTVEAYKIPQCYLDKASDALVASLQALRVNNKLHPLKEDVADYKWTMDLLKNARAGIWDLTLPSSGSGFEIATALQLKKPCLLLFDRQYVTAVLNGSTSRYLVLRHWSEGVEKTIEDFLAKVEHQYDRKIVFSVTNEMGEQIETLYKEQGFQHMSDFLRFSMEKMLKEFGRTEND